MGEHFSLSRISNISRAASKASIKSAVFVTKWTNTHITYWSLVLWLKVTFGNLKEYVFRINYYLLLDYEYKSSECLVSLFLCGMILHTYPGVKFWIQSV